MERNIPSTNNIPDSLYIREKIDEISRHHSKFKEDISIVKEMLGKLEGTLIGNEYNGHKGIIDLVDKIDDRLYEQERQMIVVKGAVDEYKWTARALILAMIGFVFWFIKSLK